MASKNESSNSGVTPSKCSCDSISLLPPKVNDDASPPAYQASHDADLASTPTGQAQRFRPQSYGSALRMTAVGTATPRTTSGDNGHNRFICGGDLERGRPRKPKFTPQMLEEWTMALFPAVFLVIVSVTFLMCCVMMFFVARHELYGNPK